MLKLKPCSHPQAAERTVDADNKWCGQCGALRVLGQWHLPRTVTDPRRYLAAEPSDLPPNADRRAWEGFAGAMGPAALQLVGSTPGLVDPENSESNYHQASNIAAELADHLLARWADRFAPEEDAPPPAAPLATNGVEVP